MIALRLPETIEKKLKELSAKTGKTKSFLAREAIIEYLENIKDYQIAVKRLQNPSRKIWSLEELELGRDLEG